MKYSVLIAGLAGTVFFLLTGCGGRSGYPKHVAGKAHVLDSIYKAHADSISNFISRLSWLEDHPDLSKPIAEPDTASGLTVLALADDDSALTACADSIIITVHNSIILNNRTNLTYLNGEDSTRKQAKTNYFITEFARNTPADLPLFTDAFIPDYWFYYNDPGYFNTYTDSLYAEELTVLQQETAKKLSTLRDIKYIVLLNDKMVIYPRLISNKTFESGHMISTVKVYEPGSHRLLCRGLLETISSDEVEHLFGGVNDDLMKKVLTIRLNEDFCQQRNKKLISFLNLHR
jgi:hypothetical protein